MRTPASASLSVARASRPEGVAVLDPARTLFFDFETASAVNLQTAGAFRYARDQSSRAIVLSYALGDGPVRVWHANGANLDWRDAPSDLVGAVEAGWPLAAWNSAFDALIWNHTAAGFPRLPVERFYDIAVMARASNLPGNLAEACEVLGCAQKDLGAWPTT
jgi:hypothetical protein